VEEAHPGRWRMTLCVQHTLGGGAGRGRLLQGTLEGRGLGFATLGVAGDLPTINLIVAEILKFSMGSHYYDGRGRY